MKDKITALNAIWDQHVNEKNAIEMLDLSASLNLAVLYVSNTTRFKSSDYKQIIPNISLATDTLTYLRNKSVREK